MPLVGYAVMIYNEGEPDTATLMPRNKLFLEMSGAESLGLYVLDHWPESIVMLLTLGTGICKHCNIAIHERPGWVLEENKWAHNNTGAVLCFAQTKNRAKPGGST